MAARRDAESAGWFWLAALCSAAVLVSQFLIPRGTNTFLRVAGVACLLTSPIFFIPPFWLLPRYGARRRGQPYYRVSVVVDRGLYAIVRHPQYVGYVLLTVGFAALAQHMLTWTLAAAAAAGFYAQSVKEERRCRVLLGPSYAEYMRRVPRFNFLLGLWRYLFAREERSA